MWTGAVASRGKLAGQSSSAALYRDGQADPSSAVVKRNNNSPEKDDIDIEVFDAPDMQLVRSNSGIDPGMADIWALADPLYQDMSKSHRFYLSYCMCYKSQRRPETPGEKKLLIGPSFFPGLLRFGRKRYA